MNIVKTIVGLGLIALLSGTVEENRTSAGEKCSVRYQRSHVAARDCQPVRSRCRPVTSCGQTTESASLSGGACVCPYYEMMGIWYAERFDWDDETDCTDGYPVSYDHDGDPMFCAPTQCGCISLLRSNRQETIRGDYWLEECLANDLATPPGETGHLTEIKGPFHLKIVNQSRDIYVIYFHMMRKTKQHTVNFWVGFECEPVEGGIRKARAYPVEGKNGILRVGPPKGASGNGAENSKDILIQITQRGCD